MSDELKSEIDRDIFRKNFLEFTRKAFHLIPTMDYPHILDIGCGSGVQTIELAMQCNGNFVAIDINEQDLAKLRYHVNVRKLTHRIQVLNCSFRDMEFPDGAFDIIWAEGIGGFITIESSLKDWKRLIKPKGFLVLHDEARKLSSKLDVVTKYGYSLKGHFLLPEDSWWKRYYEPLENKLISLRNKYQHSPALLKELVKHQNEVNSFKTNPQNSGFLILQKL